MALKTGGNNAVDGSTFVCITDGAGNLLPNPGNSALANIATNQVTIGTSATQIVPIRTARNAVTIMNLGTTDVFLGGSGVTTSTGFLLLGAKGAAVTLPVSATVYGIVATGTQAVSFMESY